MCKMASLSRAILFLKSGRVTVSSARPTRSFWIARMVEGGSWICIEGLTAHTEGSSVSGLVHAPVGKHDLLAGQGVES